MTTLYPVCCCCQPTKIFGYLELPDPPRPRYEVLAFSYASAIWEHRDLRPTPTCSVEQFTVEVRPIHLVDHSSEDYELAVHSYELAVYSDDRPIEFWRKIRGFHEYFGPFQ
jgi:hypothetical protein